VVAPKRNRPYANFLTALVQRYGPRGSFWTGQSPKVPVRFWQIWNEPNIRPAFWPPGPFAVRYVALLKAAHNAVKQADPHAKVVLAGLPNFSWIDLRRIYKIKGARQLFDVVAVHPYTKTPQGVITILSYVRQTMVKAGDAKKPMVADEVSWPSTCRQMSHGKCTKTLTTHDLGFDFTTTEQGQANNISKVMPLIAKNRVRLGLAGFYWYTWAGLERPGKLAFDFAGLFRLANGQFVAKPAFNVFRRLSLSLERCHQKGALATVCTQPY
jgi:arabinogalactan endo-1,4-beta-galactosidase